MFGVSSPNTGGEDKDFRRDAITPAKVMRTKPPKGSEMAIEVAEDHIVSSFAPASIDCQDSPALLNKVLPQIETATLVSQDGRETWRFYEKGKRLGLSHVDEKFLVVKRT